MNLLQGCVAIGVGVGGIGLRLFEIALGERAMLEQFLVQVGHAAQIFCRGQGLAIRGDGGGKIRRIYGRQFDRPDLTLRAQSRPAVCATGPEMGARMVVA